MLTLLSTFCAHGYPFAEIPAHSYLYFGLALEKRSDQLQQQTPVAVEK
jgi:hypothetical protein